MKDGALAEAGDAGDVRVARAQSTPWFPTSPVPTVGLRPNNMHELRGAEARTPQQLQTSLPSPRAPSKQGVKLPVTVCA